MAAKVCSPSGAARKCRSRSSAGKTPYPSVLLHHFILKVCIPGRASSFTFSTDSASLATDTLLNMVFRSKSSAVSSSSKVRMPAPAATPRGQDPERPKSLFCPVFFASRVILRISISSTSTASSSAEISCAFTNAVRIASRRSSGILLIYFTDAIPA